jgi:hypothetical protein
MAVGDLEILPNPPIPKSEAKKTCEEPILPHLV